MPANQSEKRLHRFAWRDSFDSNIEIAVRQRRTSGSVAMTRGCGDCICARLMRSNTASLPSVISLPVRVLLHRQQCLSQRSLYVLHNVPADKGSISQIFHTLAYYYYYYYFVKSRQDFLWNFGVDFWGQERNRHFLAVCGPGRIRKKLAFLADN